MLPRIAYISISGPDAALEAVASAAVLIRSGDRPFPYAVGLSDSDTGHPVAIEPDIRVDPEIHVTADDAEAFARDLHARAGSPAVTVTLFMVEGQDHRSFRLPAGG